MTAAAGTRETMTKELESAGTVLAGCAGVPRHAGAKAGR